MLRREAGLGDDRQENLFIRGWRNVREAGPRRLFLCRRTLGQQPQQQRKDQRRNPHLWAMNRSSRRNPSAMSAVERA